MKHINTISYRADRRTSLVLFILLVILGITAGSVYAVKNTNGLSPWIHQYFAPLSDGETVFSLMSHTFFSASLFSIAAFILGLFAVGQPLGAAMLIYRGVGIGASVASMYLMYGKSAALPVMILVLPKALAFSAIAILSVRELMRSSKALLTFCLGGDVRDDSRRGFRLYCIKFIVLIFLSLIISAADGALSCIMAGVLRQ